MTQNSTENGFSPFDNAQNSKSFTETSGKLGTKSKKRKRKNFLIAITGGIGSGKSTAASAIKSAGFKVISCDEICAKFYRSPAFLRRLKKYFPSAIKGTFSPKVDKRELSRLAFNGDENYKLLSDLVTAPVYRAAMKKARKKKGVIFIEVPLLFEFDKQNEFDKVIVVMRDTTDRAESVKKRSGLNEKEFSARISRQADYSSVNLSDYTVITNDGTKEELKKNAITAASAFYLEFLKNQSE